MKFKVFAQAIVEKLPTALRNIVYRITREVNFLIFRIKLLRNAYGNTPNPARIYWIPTERIVYHTNYLGNLREEATPFRDRVFDRNAMRGKIVDGGWDITNYKFTDLDVYEAYKQRVEKGVAWQDTEFYQRVLRQAESGRNVWGINNKADLDARCKYLDFLYNSIKNEGYLLNSPTSLDEIDVNIGRNGEYLFQDGRHRLAIAKLLGIKHVPVLVFVRHKEWQAFREFVIAHAQQIGGKLYQPIIHPDLVDMPHQEDHCQEVFNAIQPHLGKKRGVLLDIGSNLGFFCHKFEDLGYRCYAVEQDRTTFQILEKVKIAENKKFEAINKSIFEVEVIKNTKFDVVLALNVFHHFLKSKTAFNQFKNLLKNLETDELFFQAHNYQEDQMKGAYINYTETEFVDFLLQHTSLNKSELIYIAKNGRHLYKLSK